MQDFGPYVDEEISRSDFNNLNRERLFLLEGKTGCGKSTIIDAIVFGLYGSDSKKRDEEVRRNSAPAENNAKVTLEFEVNDIRYRVVRSPQWQKEGRKSKITSKVDLVEIDDEGNPIAGKSWDGANKVDPKIRSILKLSQEQFTRIVVLPQGKFSEFLQSKADDREKLLKAIFPIDDWEKIVKRITDDHSNYNKEEKKLTILVLQHAHTTRGFVNRNPESPTEKETDLTSIPQAKKVQTEAKLKIAEWATKIESERTALVKRRTEVNSQEKSLEAQKTMNDAIEERANLLVEKAGLDKLEKAIEGKNGALELDAEAVRLKIIFELLESSKKATEENGTAIDELVKDSGMDAGLKKKPNEEINDLLNSISSKITNVERVNKAQRDKTLLEKSLKDLKNEQDKAHANFGKLQHAQLKNWASQIAQHSLVRGNPCLVCGSTEHPTPADEEWGENTELGDAENAVTAAEKELENANGEIDRLEASIADLRVKLDLTAEDEIPDVESLKAYRADLRELQRLRDQGKTLVDRLNDAQGKWDKTENKYNLDTTKKLDSNTLDKKKKTQFTQDIQEYRKKRAINSDNLMKQRVIDAEGKKVIDISQDLETLDQEESALRMAEDENRDLATDTDKLKSSTSKLSQSIVDFDKEAADSKDLVWVFKHLTGKEGAEMKMSIIAWLLRRFFSSALANANKQLTQIGNGRYSLEMEKTGKHDKLRTGLNIGVIDALSGSLKPRPTTSLSGGESFYISLALALGMSDVVSQETGGITLGTLFIDEGFGTLDQDTLDDVMAVIDDIQGNDRVIGIISHVESLKQRIASRISVTNNGDGTSTAKVEA